MAIEIGWTLKDRVLNVTLTDVIGDADERHFEEALLYYLDQHEGEPIHLITNYSDVEQVETTVRTTQPTVNGERVIKHSALGSVVVVDDSMVNYLSAFSAKLLAVCKAQVSTVDEALDVLMESDSSLSGLGAKNLS